MREIKKIKLNQFSKNELDQRKLNALKGGCLCSATNCGGCTCQVWGLDQNGAYTNRSSMDSGNGYYSVYEY